MANQDKLFQKRLTELIQWYDSDFKLPKRTAKVMLVDLKKLIKNSNCSTCEEDSDDEIVVKKHKKYPVKMWKCEVCDVNMTIYNKSNHLKSIKHQNKENESDSN